MVSCKGVLGSGAKSLFQSSRYMLLNQSLLILMFTALTERKYWRKVLQVPDRDVYIKTYAELLIFSYQQNQTKNLHAQLRTLLV